MSAINPSDTIPTITGVGGERLVATHTATRGILGDTLVVPAATANLASLATILDNNPGAVFDGDAERFIIYKDSSLNDALITASRSPGSRLWILDDDNPAYASGSSVWGAPLTSQVSIPRVTSKHYSREQRLRAMRARMLHKALAHPCDAALCKALDNGLYINVPLTSEDVRAAHDIFGTCPACLMGKMTAGPEQDESMLHPPATKPGQVLHMDKAKLLPERSVGGFVEHLVSVCEHTGKVHAIPMRGGTEADIEAAEMVIISWYKKLGHDVKTIVSDHENAFLAGQTSRNHRGIEFQATPPGLHEKAVERVIREIRDKCRATTADLPYKVPGPLYGELVNFVVNALGDTPCAKSSSSTPNQLCTGKKLVQATLPIPWGTPVVAHDKVGADGGKQKQADRGVVGIVVGLSITTYGAYRVFAPLHRGTVDRRKVTILSSIPAEWGWQAKHKPVFDNAARSAILPISQPPQSITHPNAFDLYEGMNSARESTIVPTDPGSDQGQVPIGNTSVAEPQLNISTDNDTTVQTSLPDAGWQIDQPDHHDDTSPSRPGLPLSPSTTTGHDPGLAETTDQPDMSDQPSSGDWMTVSNRYNIRQRQGIDYRHLATEGYVADTSTLDLHAVGGDNNSASYFSAFLVKQARLSVKQYLQGPHRQRGLEAMKAEVLNLQSNNVGTPCRYADIPRAERGNLLRTFMFLKDSFDSNTGEYKKTKARLVSDGSQQKQGTGFGDSESHTLSPISLFILLALTAHLDYELKTYDVPGAFLKSVFVSSSSEKQVYVLLDASVARIWCDLQPTAREALNARGELILKLDKCLYGLKQSPKHWYDTLSARLISLGYKQSPYDRCLFYKQDGSHRMYAGFHVDDLLTPGTRGTHLRKELEEGLDSTFGPLTRGAGNSFTGFHIEHDRASRTVHVSMPTYARSILARYPDLNSVPAYKTPGTPDFFKASTDTKRESSHEYLSKLMALMYYARFVCPELLPCVCFLSAQSQSPTQGDLRKLHRLFGYVKSNPDRSITIKPCHLRIGASVDAAYGLHPGGESHTGMILTLGGAPIGYKSNKQKSISTSSTGAEVIALADSLPVVIWARDLLTDLGFPQSQPARIGQDNLSAITQTSKPCTFKRSKNLLIKLAWIREQVTEGVVAMEHIPGDKLSADLLTKPVTGAAFHSKIKRFRGGDYIN
jgi:hypothetical protein